MPLTRRLISNQARYQFRSHLRSLVLQIGFKPMSRG